MEVNIYFDPEEIQHEYDYVCKRINLFGLRIPLYDFLMGYWERKSNRVLVNHVEASNPSEIIQLGLGTGYLMGLLCKKYPNSRFRGSDLSPGMIDCTQDHLLKRGHTEELANQTISLNVEDCRSLPISDNSYDLAITSYLVDLMPPQDILSVLEEIKRILKPGKKAYVVGLTTEVEKGKGFFGRIKEIYFKLCNSSYKFCYHNVFLRKLSYKLFNGYYTHCRPIAINDYIKRVEGMQVTKEIQTYIQILGIPYLPVKIVEIVKE